MSTGTASESPAAAAERPSGGAIAGLILLLSSGFAFIYWLCWVRLAAIQYGTPGQAVSLVVLTYLGGYALGSFLFARIGGSQSRPLRLVGILQLAIGGLAIISPTLMGVLDGMYGGSYATYVGTTTLVVLKLVAIAVAVLPGTLLLGGVTPLYARHFVASNEEISVPLGRIFTLQMMGVAAGVLGFAYFLLPQFGLDLTLLIVGAANMAIGLVMVVLPAKAPELPDMPEPEEDDDDEPVDEADEESESEDSDDGEEDDDEEDDDDDDEEEDDEYDDDEDEGEFELTDAGYRKVVNALFFLMGLVVLGSQLIWLRYLPLVTQSTVETRAMLFGVMFFAFGLGALLTSGSGDRPARAFVFSIFQILLAISFATLLLMQPSVWTPVLMLGGSLAQLAIIASLIALPSLFIGMSYPFAARMAVQYAKLGAGGIGNALGFGALGGLVGAGIVGFIAIPYVDMGLTLKMLSGISVLIGFVGLIGLDRAFSQVVRALVVVVAAGVWIGLTNYLLLTQIPGDYLAVQGRPVWDERGASGHYTVVNPENPRLELDREFIASLRRDERVMAAHVPALLNDSRAKVAVLGVGSGQIGQRFLYDDYGVEEITVVDVERNLITSLISDPAFNGAWLNNEKVRVVYDDGRNYLSHIDEAFDIICVNMAPFRRVAARYYSEEFYEQAKQRLTENGIFCQSIPVDALSKTGFQRIARAFHDAFSSCHVWYNGSQLLLLGSTGTIDISWDRDIPLLQQSKNIKADLDFDHWGGKSQRLNDSSVFLSGYLVGPDGLRAMGEGVSPIVDSVPTLEMTRLVEYDEQRALLDMLEENRGDVKTLISDIQTAKLPDLLFDRIDQLRHFNVKHLLARQHIRMGRDFLGQGFVEDALGQFQMAKELVPNLGEAFEGAGESYSRMAFNVRQQQQARDARYKLAIEELESAVAINPLSGNAHMLLAFQYLALADAQRAISHFRSAIAVDQKDLKAIGGLARLLAAHPNPEIRDGKEAVRLCEQGMKIEAEQGRNPHPQLFDIYAIALAANEQYSDAVKAAERAANEYRMRGQNPQAEEVNKRLALFKTGRAYIEQTLFRSYSQ